MRPHAEIDRIGSRHPPQEQVQPLARAAGGRSRKKARHSWADWHAAVGCADIYRKRTCREGLEGGTNVRRSGIVTRHEEPFD